MLSVIDHRHTTLGIKKYRKQYNKFEINASQDDEAVHSRQTAQVIERRKEVISLSSRSVDRRTYGRSASENGADVFQVPLPPLARL